MQDRPGEFQRLYVEQLDKFKMEMDGPQQAAKTDPGRPMNIGGVVYIFGELTKTIEALGSYVTVLEEELRRRK